MSHVRPDSNASESPDGDRGRRLDSWKEIAAYLGRDVATVRRWEKREGLAVHRHLHHKLGSVFAFTAELDAWLEGRRQIRASEPAGGNGPAVEQRSVFRRVSPAALTLVALATAVAGYAWLGRQPTKGTAALVATVPAAVEGRPNGALRPTANPQAYESYLRGRHFMAPGVGESARKAAEAFEQAVKLDPSFALAHAGLSSAYASLANSTIMPSKDAYLRARRAALRALELDPTLGEPHTTIGAVSLLYDWNWPDAEQAFRRALERQPDDARTLRRYAIGLMWLGRFAEAEARMRRARELAPVDLEISANLALVLYYARRYEEAIAAARKTLEMDPGFSQAHRTIARSLVEQGRHEQAISEYQQAIATGGVQLLKAELGHAYAVAGRRADAVKIRDELRELGTKRYVSPYDMAILHIALGEHERAFQWLEKSYAERERWMVTLKVAPALDPLRRDPRFADLMQRVGLWK